MILYHGTDEINGEKILQDKLIKAEVERIYDKDHLVLPTTDGYVYLTNNIRKALRYASNNLIMKDLNLRETKVYIFAVTLDIDEVEVDWDEVKVDSRWPNSKANKVVDAITSLEYLSSVRIKKDLEIGKEVTSYFGGIYLSDEIIYMRDDNSSDEDKMRKFDWIKLDSSYNKINSIN